MRYYRKAWRPHCCTSCGDPLEDDPGFPLEPETMVPCYRCGLLFVVTETGVERVLLSLEPPELQRVFAELLESWWTQQRCRQQVRPHPAAA